MQDRHRILGIHIAPTMCNRIGSESRGNPRSKGAHVRAPAAISDARAEGADNAHRPKNGERQMRQHQSSTSPSQPANARRLFLGAVGFAHSAWGANSDVAFGTSCALVKTRHSAGPSYIRRFDSTQASRARTSRSNVPRTRKVDEVFKGGWLQQRNLAGQVVRTRTGSSIARDECKTCHSNKTVHSNPVNSDGKS